MRIYIYICLLYNLNLYNYIVEIFEDSQILPYLPVTDSEIMAEHRIPLSQRQRAFSRQSRQYEHQHVCAVSPCSQAPLGDVRGQQS